jgi:hypothetical protein
MLCEKPKFMVSIHFGFCSISKNLNISHSALAKCIENVYNKDDYPKSARMNVNCLCFK